MLLYNLIKGGGMLRCSVAERELGRTHPQNSSTLSMFMTLLISSIHP